MEVLEILSQIWKSGADIYLDPTDKRVAIKKQELILKQTMELAEQHFQQIDEWFKSWKGASAIEQTALKVFFQFCGWQDNPKIFQWLQADEYSTKLIYEWTVILHKNGWNNHFEDYRKYENDESRLFSKEIHKRAVIFYKK